MAININKGPGLGKYYYTKDNVVFGPIPLEELLKYINADTLVYYEGIKWTEAKNLPELNKIISNVKQEEKANQEKLKREQVKEYDDFLNKPKTKSPLFYLILIGLIILVIYFFVNQSKSNQSEVSLPIATDTMPLLDSFSMPQQTAPLSIDEIYTNILSSNYISESQLERLLFSEILNYKNEILARHGYIFEDEGLTENYRKYPWYSPINNYLVATSQFNEFEKANYDLLEKRYNIITSSINNLIQQFYQSIRDRTFDANMFFASSVEKYLNRSNLTQDDIDEEVQKHYAEFLNARYTFPEPFDISVLESANSLNYISYKFHYEVERVSKNKLQSCDVTVVLGLNSDFKIVDYSEAKVENLKFTEIPINTIDSLTQK